MGQVVSQADELFQLLSRTSFSTTLTALGFLLLAVGIGSLHQILKSKPEDTPGWLKFLAAGSFVVGVMFAAAGPSVALLDLNSSPIKLISTDKSLANLKENKKVSWLIRLIPYTPGKQDHLSVTNLKNLGPDPVMYTFVSPYEELKGYNVKDAVDMVGGALIKGQRVSAVIFPIVDAIIPASGRGLLQVIERIESDGENKINRAFMPEADLNKDEKEDISEQRHMASWSWASLKPKYKRYCELAHKFRCNPGYDARKYVSIIERDWHPIGAARYTSENPCRRGPSYCEIDDWDNISQDIGGAFGARVFFMRNRPLEQLGTRYMIDFHDPENQFIPEIDAGRSDSERSGSRNRLKRREG